MERLKLTTGVALIIAVLGSGLIGGIIGAALGSERSAEIVQRASGTTLSVQEESQTTKVVDAALPGVASIVITKEFQQFSNRTGPNLFPFDDFFEFGLTQPGPPERVRQQVGGGSGFIDLAVIKIDARDLPILKLGDSDSLKIGQSVIAIGYTLSEYKNTVTKGVVSGIGRRVVAGDGFQSSVLEGAIQTDAAINPGNSGGPLLDLSGAVIGINTAVNREGQLIGFAIPANEAKRVIESVQKHGRIVRPWLGVRYVAITKELAAKNGLDVDYGALVIRGDQQDELAVMPGSPADKSGLEENDIILEVDGKRLQEDAPLARIVGSKQPGEKIELKILRKGQEKKLVVTLEERK